MSVRAQSIIITIQYLFIKTVPCICVFRNDILPLDNLLVCSSLEKTVFPPLNLPQLPGVRHEELRPRGLP